MPVLTFSPRAIVWLCWRLDPPPSPFPTAPVFTFVLSFEARAAVWLWLSVILQDFTFVFIFKVVFPFLENLIAASVAAYLYRRKRNAKLLYLTHGFEAESERLLIP
jgi:hypothetical protein